MPAPQYPVNLDVAGRRCLVVGGGRVAARKVAGLLACGANVTVVAPDVVAEITGAGSSVEIALRDYEPGEASRYRLVIAATGDRSVDRAVAADAEAAGIWVNVADDPSACTFTLPAVHRDGAVTVAVATSGASPATAAWLRDRVAALAGPGIGDLADLLAGARRRLRREGIATEGLPWKSLLDSIADTVASGDVGQARRSVTEWEADQVRAGAGAPQDAPGQVSPPGTLRSP
ncbi:MAG: bifunctional precorrin-2 dehydrogenase/sirohydrochlorin ferrochelatase [Actinomycetota bacterium]|jgi:siroheme synthase-like protein|nr:bifunctional precorrin-2 dehydrogenase/sirohydrochlorin ferrochelatase [Actinomycetota bacterium]